MSDAPLDADAVQRVLRRASELSATGSAVDPHRGMTEDLVLAAASEAGIDSDAVRLSLAIERVGSTPPPERFDSLAGASVVVVDRVVSMSPDVTLARANDLLIRRHGLRRSRERIDRGEWRRRTDAVGSIQRAAQKFGAEGPTLAGLDRIEVRTSVVDERRTFVRVVASRRPQRKVALAGGATMGVAGVMAGAAAAVITPPLALVGVPLAASGILVARSGQRQAGELIDDLERLLDVIEREMPAASLSDELKKMLKQQRRR